MTTTQNLGLDKLRGRPRAAGVTSGQLVRSAPLDPDRSLPLVASPAVDGVDLVSWAGNNRDWVERQLDRHGGILFRGFGIDSTARLEALIVALYGSLLTYNDRVQPRSQVSGNVYTSTEYPADQAIELHNECSYSHSWPMRIFFLCLQPAEHGGATPIADCRRVLERIDPAVREHFIERQVQYVRNLGDGFGISWQEAFQTDSRVEMEAFCARTGVRLEWKGDGRLRTRSVRPVAVEHPRTGEAVWFNAAVSSHISTVEPSVRATLEAEFAPDELPKNSLYGDGRPIEPETLEAVRRAYREETVTFDWQRGDVLLLDNMLACHGRAPYRGARKLVVGMAEPIDLNAIRAPG
jgi:alpha-ketoglutarate-dependent taurine dioxygenase